MPGVNVAGLRKLYNSSRSAKAALDYLAARQKNSAHTTVDSLKAALRADGQDVARSELIDLFKELAAAGCGKFVVGRKGHPSRFEWTVSLADVGRSAAGETVKVEAITASKGDAKLDTEDADQLIQHRFRLRSDLELLFALPANFTLAEASRLADFFRTLPFPIPE